MLGDVLLGDISWGDVSLGDVSWGDVLSVNPPRNVPLDKTSP